MSGTDKRPWYHERPVDWENPQAQVFLNVVSELLSDHDTAEMHLALVGVRGVADIFLSSGKSSTVKWWVVIDKRLVPEGKLAKFIEHIIPEIRGHSEKIGYQKVVTP